MRRLELPFKIFFFIVYYLVDKIKKEYRKVNESSAKYCFAGLRLLVHIPVISGNGSILVSYPFLWLMRLKKHAQCF